MVLLLELSSVVGCQSSPEAELVVEAGQTSVSNSDAVSVGGSLVEILDICLSLNDAE